MGISPLQYEQMRDKTERAKDKPYASLYGNKFAAKKVDNEVRELHQPILAWLKSNNVAYKYSRPDKKSRDTKGSPDFCFCWHSKTIWIECKSEDGELRPEQKVWARQALDQGQFVHVIYNMQQFYDLVRV